MQFTNLEQQVGPDMTRPNAATEVLRRQVENLTQPAVSPRVGIDRRGFGIRFTDWRPLPPQCWTGRLEGWGHWPVSAVRPPRPGVVPRALARNGGLLCRLTTKPR